MSYKLQFTGPTGTNAVEAALKLARKRTERTTIAAFTHAFHGVSLGALAATANMDKRRVSGVELSNVVRLPYDGFFGPGIDSADIISTLYHTPEAATSHRRRSFSKPCRAKADSTAHSPSG